MVRWYRGTFVEGNSTEIKVQFSDGAQIIIPNTGDNIKIPSRWNLLLESIFHDIAQLKLAYGRIGEEEYRIKMSYNIINKFKILLQYKAINDENKIKKYCQLLINIY